MTSPSSNSRADRLRAAIRQKRAAVSSSESNLPQRPSLEPALLDVLQHGIWLAHRMDNPSPTYNMVSAGTTVQPLEIERLATAFHRLVNTHRLLRSTFHAQGDSVEQRIQDSVAAAIDRQTVPGDRLLDVMQQAACLPFDLASAPLIRLHVIESNDESHLSGFVLVVHHLVCDERSIQVLWQELALAMSTELEAPSFQYDDWAFGRRSESSSSDPQERTYWQRRLNPLPAALDLPFARRPSTESSAGQMIFRTLAGDTTAAIRLLAREAGTTPFAVGAFTFRLLLQRFAADSTFAFATPASVRLESALESTLGAFINTVVIRAAIDETASVLGAMRGFETQLREDLAHSKTPFSELARALDSQRVGGRHPLVQAMFVYQRSEQYPRLGSASLKPVRLLTGTAKFELSVFLSEGEGSFEAGVEYRVDTFEHAQMRKLLERYEQLLCQLGEGLTRRVADIPHLTNEERSHVASFTRGPVLTPPTRAMLPDQIENTVRLNPGMEAVCTSTESVDFANLRSMATSISALLAEVGVQAGDRVGLYLPRTPLLIASILAIHRLRAAYVPLDPGYPAERNHSILIDANVAAVLVVESFQSECPTGRWPLVSLERLSSFDRASVFQSDTDEAPVATQSDDIAYLLYTSGSSGMPKGVVVTHGNLAASTAARIQVYGSSVPRYLLLPSVAFDSSVAGIFSTLSAGGTLVIPDEKQLLDFPAIAELIEHRCVTHLLCVPTWYRALLRSASESLRGLKVVIVAGEPCPPELPQEHFGLLPEVRLFNEYGPTEATVWATVQELSAEDAQRTVPVGRPIPGASVEVLDSNGRSVPIGVRGQGVVGGPTVAFGYWKKERLTGERFFGSIDRPSERRYWTGDVLSWNEDGSLSFHGREDDQLKLNGIRVEPGEVEAALRELSLQDGELTDVAVVAQAATGEANDSFKQLVAFVTGDQLLPGQEPSDWRDQLANVLPSYLLPARMEVLAELPKLPNGKTDRQALLNRRLKSKRTGATLSTAASTSSTETVLQSLWAGFLGVETVELDENFFQLGGSSMLALRLSIEIERELGVPLSAAELFSNPTVRQLADHLKRNRGTVVPSFDHLFSLQPGGNRDPFIVAIPHFFAELFIERFRDERPVYGLRGVGHRPEGNLGRWSSMEVLGAELAEEVERRFPGQAVYLAGYSFGASMAVEAARCLEQRGVTVRGLWLIAPMPLNIARVGPLRLELEGLCEPIDTLTPWQCVRRWCRANPPWSIKPYRRMWNATAVEGWRRALCWLGHLWRARGMDLTEAMQWADVRVNRFRLHAHYVPKTLSVPTVFFNPQEPATDSAATWRRVFSGSLEIVASPDPHLGLSSVTASQALIESRLETLESA
ncbi:MAG: amino acid adenylation domain-containing protein [Pseudomonadota bacterium]